MVLSIQYPAGAENAKDEKNIISQHDKDPE